MHFYRLPTHIAFTRQRGFTLIELVAAFVIFALAFGILMSILTGALRVTTQSADYTQAALWAQSLLDTQGIGEKLQEGSSSGNFDNTYSWQLNVAKYQPPASNNAPVATSGPGAELGNAVDLYQLELIVQWGNRYLMHNARFVTLRAAMPDVGAPGMPATGVRNPIMQPTRGGGNG